MTRLSHLESTSDGRSTPSLPIQRSQKRIKQSGFTLMEALIGISVIGLLAGMTFSRTDSWDRFATKGAADRFISAHHKARTAAVRFGAVAEIRIEPSTDRFWVQIDTSVSESGVMDTIGAVVDLSEDQVDLRATGSLLCFDPRGLVAAAAGCPTTGSLAVAFSRGDSSDSLTVTASGLLFKASQ